MAGSAAVAPASASMAEVRPLCCDVATIRLKRAGGGGYIGGDSGGRPGTSFIYPGFLNTTLEVSVVDGSQESSVGTGQGPGAVVITYVRSL